MTFGRLPINQTTIFISTSIGIRERLTTSYNAPVAFPSRVLAILKERAIEAGC